METEPLIRSVKLPALARLNSRAGAGFRMLKGKQHLTRGRDLLTSKKLPYRETRPPRIAPSQGAKW